MVVMVVVVAVGREEEKMDRGLIDGEDKDHSEHVDSCFLLTVAGEIMPPAATALQPDLGRWAACCPGALAHVEEACSLLEHGCYPWGLAGRASAQVQLGRPRSLRLQDGELEKGREVSGLDQE